MPLRVSAAGRAMAETSYRFRYHPREGEQVLDAYDASQALYGIARSLSILTHYTINQTVIKQAPALRGARILVEPPRAGSFEFLIPILSLNAPTSLVGAAVFGLGINFLHDLTKTIFSRLSGKNENPTTETMREVLRRAPGDVDALSDAVEEDIVRIQRPIVNNVVNINITGGSHHIINLDHDTFDFAKTKVLGEGPMEFEGHVRSLNGSTVAGRFWVDNEERTVGFSVDRSVVKLPPDQRGLLADSLRDWVNGNGGSIVIRGTPLTSKQGLLKHIFLTRVSE
jgi:hypothetical protein